MTTAPLRTRFDASLAAARQAGAPFEEALTLDALGQTRAAAAILRGLGVVRVARPALEQLQQAGLVEHRHA